jgi:hypothetical protein
MDISEFGLIDYQLDILSYESSFLYMNLIIPIILLIQYTNKKHGT